VIDADSFAFRHFSFRGLFERYARRPTIFLGGPTTPLAARCHVKTLLANWGMTAPSEGLGYEHLHVVLDLEPFHDDYWVWEGPVIDELVANMRGGEGAERRSLAIAVLNGSVHGTYSEQIIYSNWVLMQQQRQPGKYSHIRRLDVEKLAVSRWPHLNLERHLARLRLHRHAVKSSQVKSSGGGAFRGHPMLGPTLARLHAAFSLGLDADQADDAARRRLRLELIQFLNESDWVFVRGWQPSPWTAVADLLPEWPGALCLSNCELDESQARAIKLKLQG